MTWQRLWKNTSHRQDDKGSYHHEFVGDRIEDSAELGLLFEPASEEAVESVSHSRDDENGQGKDKALVKKEGYENRDQHHPEDSEQIGNRKNPGGHQSVNGEW